MLHIGWGFTRALVLGCLLVPAGCYFDFGEADSDGGQASDGGETSGDGSIGVDGAIGPDSGEPDGSVTPLDPIPMGPFDTLSESMLYANMATYTVRADILPFEPEFKLWTDRAAKKRWIWLPPGSQIGTANMGRWVFPVGTTVWKEFSEPDTGKRYETRIIQRLEADACNNPPCFYYASFIWDEDDTEAYFDDTMANEPPVDIPAGCSTCASPPCDLADFPDDCHVVPQATSSTGNNGGECNRCHGGEPYKILGFSAVQLSYDAETDMVDIDDLVAMGVLSANPPVDADYSVPGTPVERAAIGYLHANCGHCHFSTATHQNCYPLTQFATRVRPEDEFVTDTTAYLSGVDQDLAYWVGTTQGNYTDPPITKRIVSGDPASSAVVHRMSVREWGQISPYDDHQQMPTLGTHEVDATGLTAVETWIGSLGQ